MNKLHDIPAPIWVTAAKGKYPLYIGENLLSLASVFQTHLHGKQVFILSHPEVAIHYLPSLIQVCQALGLTQIDHLLIPSGERHKTLDIADQIWSTLIEKQHHRDTTLIALGGGMIGDLAGFCAACYLRGVNVIQCPTTLLAQIDAAIGGKTGVNHPQGKNLIGAFHQPQAVIGDLTTLTTLGQREFVSGLAELIKYGISLDAALFEWLEKHISDILAKKGEALTSSVRWAASIKANIVSADEKEQDLRRVLNYGHTIGHAIENIQNYQGWLHGEAVALGMIAATHLSIQQGNVPFELLGRLINLLKCVGLPTKIPKKITTSTILSKLKQDKKHKHQKLQWVLLKSLGEPNMTEEVTLLQIETALKYCGAE